jgi:hypothetical protein
MSEACMPPLLSPVHIALIAKGVSVIAASHDLANRPSIMRAVGSAISADGRSITVFLSRPQARQLLADVATTGRIAVVFSEPSSHCSVQVKGVRAAIRAGGPEDLPVLHRYLKSMERELAQIAFGPEFARTMLSHRVEDLVAITFEPVAAFDQTPGPKAGTALLPAAAAPAPAPHGAPAPARTAARPGDA